MELVTRGYKEEFVRNAVAKRVKQISKMFNDDFTLRTSRKEHEGGVSLWGQEYL